MEKKPQRLPKPEPKKKLQLKRLVVRTNLRAGEDRKGKIQSVDCSY